MRPAAALAVAGVLAAACSRKEPAKPEAPASAPALPAPAPAPYDPGAPYPGSERLQGILGRMQAEGAPWNVEFAIGDLRPAFEDKARAWSALNMADAKYAGVSPPELRDFDEEDKRNRGPRAKWYAADGVHYGSALPSSGEGVLEAWWRVYGFKDMSGGGYIMVMSDVPADKWVRMQWQPNKRRWHYFGEAEDQAGRAALIESRLAKLDPDSHRSAKFAIERMAKAIREAELQGRESEGYRREIKKAILEGYGPEITLEAARWALEQ